MRTDPMVLFGSRLLNANSGANIVAKLYSFGKCSFSTVAAPLHANHHTAIFKLDAANGGTGLSVGDLYTQFNITEQIMTAADALTLHQTWVTSNYSDTKVEQRQLQVY